MAHYTYIPERKKEYNRRYREKLKEKGISYADVVKKWKEKNREKVLEYHRNYNKLYVKGIRSHKIKIKELRKLNLQKCENCGYKKYLEILIVHHIKHKSKGGTSEISNLQVLCPNCHALHHRNGLNISSLQSISIK